MDPLSVGSSILTLSITVVQLTSAVLDSYAIIVRRTASIIRVYGLNGMVLICFGSRATWQLQAQVLGQVDDHQAIEFKRSAQEECSMISTAAAITAQISITALALSNLSQTHWLVRGFSVFSLTSALMAVYYATIQHKMFGRLLTAKQVRTWIRGGTSSLNGLSFLMSTYSVVNLMSLFLSKESITSRYNDPQELKSHDINTRSSETIRSSLVRLSFVPGITSVITMSAPQLLLSAALLSLLIALGVYLGFIWTRNLDTSAGLHDSRNVFIMYVIGLRVCILVYSISQIVQSADSKLEEQIVDEYMKAYVRAHPGWLPSLNIDVKDDLHGRLVFTKIMGPDGTDLDSSV